MMPHGLPRSQRQALTLHYLEDRPYDEIAARMGVPLNTVKSHVLRGKERMLRLLAGRYFGLVARTFLAAVRRRNRRHVPMLGHESSLIVAAHRKERD